MSKLSLLLQEEVVRPLNGLGVPIDLRDLQAVLLLLPVLIVVAAFIHTSWRKQRDLKDLE